MRWENRREIQEQFGRKIKALVFLFSEHKRFFYTKRAIIFIWKETGRNYRYNDLKEYHYKDVLIQYQRIRVANIRDYGKKISEIYQYSR